MITGTNELILQIVDKITEFLMKDMQTEKDFREFTQFGTKHFSIDEKRSRTLTYLYTRKISNRSMFDYYMGKTLNLAQKEIEVIEALKRAFAGVFEIKKVLNDGFELYSIINEKDYVVSALGTKTAFRGAYAGAFLYCCLCKIDDKYYVYDTRAITGADKIGGAQRYAVSRIIDKPDIIFYDNDNKLKEIKEQIKDFEQKFTECFEGLELVTTNKFADDVINAFNDYCESGNKSEIDEIKEKGIEQPEKYEYFPTKDFHVTGNDFAKKSMAGFSAQGSVYDVGILFVKNSGLYAIPFYGTFCKIFEADDYKSINNYEACVRNFLNNDKIPNVVLKRVADKYTNFVSRINEIEGTKYDFDGLMKHYKPQNIGKEVISPASILYSSKVFAQIMMREVRLEEKAQEPKVEKVGRNDLCPCGSGKKYKKCCMLKEQTED